jgi:hypothetical protein
VCARERLESPSDSGTSPGVPGRTFPADCRHLAYVQTKIGYKVKLDMPMPKGPVVEALHRRRARRLAGGALQR